jgi:hypothetical protein
MKILVILSIFSVIVLIIGVSVRGLKFIHDIIDSLTTEKDGFSTKKILVYIGIVFAGIITVKHTDKENAESFLLTWLGFICLVQGLITIPQLIQLKTGTTTTTTNTDNTTKTTKVTTDAANP